MGHYYNYFSSKTNGIYHVQIKEEGSACVHDVGSPVDGDGRVEETVEGLHPVHG